MNQRRPSGIPWPRTLLLLTGAVASLGALGWALQQQPAATVQASENGQQPVDFDDATKLDDNGRFTGPGQQWPPQPKGATQIVVRDLGELEATSQQRTLERLDADAGPARAPSELVANNAAAQDALGSDHNLIAVEDTDPGAHLIYYSLTNNQTVEVIVAGGVVATVDRHRPTDFQPELSVDEKQAAIDVARAHWQTRGDARIDSLQGFSILAFQPGGSYYDTRMVYVSFHIDEDARPELLTWVDLVTGTVTKSEVDR